MPFTFVEIDERRTSKLAWLFACLVLIYVLSLAALGFGLPLLSWRTRLSPGGFAVLAAIALFAAAIHWLLSVNNLTGRVMAMLQARPLDPGDTYHQRLQHVVEEAGVATGGRYQITPYVISSSALNACAVADFDRRAGIAVTEGLLARLTREQLEGVVGHEAAHIARGDSLAKSVFTGLFGLHEEVLKRLSGAFGDEGSRIRGRGAAYLLFVMLVLWLTKCAKRLCELGISRQMEYRADAVAVRLTRNPVGLAEALQLMEGRWRGVGAYGESLSTIFILDPGGDQLTESDGMFASLFTTHPPTRRRVRALLDMVGVAQAGFEQELERRPERSRVQAPDVQLPDPAASRWTAYINGAWTAPLPLDQFAALPGLLPDSWVQAEGSRAVVPAYRDPQVLVSLQKRFDPGGPRAGAAMDCPKCRTGLGQELYEGVPLDVCSACRGRYVTTDQLSRILLRQEYAFPEEVARMAKAIPPEPVRGNILRMYMADRHSQWRCPKCQATMYRKFYSLTYFVDVEQCVFCGLTWLDRHELELLQYLYEHRTDE